MKKLILLLCLLALSAFGGGKVYIHNNSNGIIGQWGTGGQTNVCWFVYAGPSSFGVGYGIGSGTTGLAFDFYNNMWGAGTYVFHNSCNGTSDDVVIGTYVFDGTSSCADATYQTAYCSGGAPVVTNYCTFTIKNNNSFNVAYQLVTRSTGALLLGQYGGTYYTAQPGEIARLTVKTTNSCDTIGVQMFWGAPPDLYMTQNGGGYMTNGYGYGSSGTMPTNSYDIAGVTGGPYNLTNTPPTYTPPPSVTYSNPANWGSNQAISFNTNAVVGDNINTLQTGFSALYNAINANGANIDGKLGAIDSDLKSGFAGASNLLGSIDGKLGGLGTNNINGMASNYYNMMLTNATAHGNTNWIGDLTSDTRFTTGDGASSYATTELGGPKGSLEGLASSAGSVGGAVGSGFPSSSAFDFTIRSGVSLQGGGNGDFHIQPLATLPHTNGLSFAALAASAKSVFTWIAYLAYFILCLKEVKEWWINIMNARGTTIPNIQAEFAGFGGNVAGAILYPIIVAVVLALWAANLAQLAGLAVGDYTLSSLLTLLQGDPLASGKGAGGPISAGIGLVGEFIPVPLIFALLGAGLVFKLTAMKIAMLAIGALRVLIH